MQDIWIAPTITGVFAVIISLVGGVMAFRGSRIGAKEQRAPDVQEMWAQQDHDRRSRQAVEDMWWNLRRAFQSYFRRVTSAVMKMDISDAQRKAFELNTKELAAIEATPPDL